MIERAQFDMGVESNRVTAMNAQGFSSEEQMTYVERQLITDIGERVDRAQSHYVYEIKDGKMFGHGLSEPFIEVMERGILQKWEGSRENAELRGYEFVQSFMADPATRDGAMIFNPSPPDGENYQKNYLDVYKKVGNEVHTVRYLSDVSNAKYREKILAINPSYAEVIPEEPKDTDFFLNPVVVPDHLDINPDDLAEFVLGGKKGMDEYEFERIISENTWLITSVINTLIENPSALSAHETNQKALYAGVRNSKDGVTRPQFNLPQVEIHYLSQQKETLGGGGCGSGACSTGETSSLAKALGLEPDKHGERVFNCPECGKMNVRWAKDQILSNCQNCGSDKVLPPGFRLQNSQPGLAKEQ